MEFLRALLISADDAALRSMRTVLEPNGIECLMAKDGVEALQLASEYGVDLVVTDLDTPRINGEELLRLARLGVFGRNPPPVIVCLNETQHDLIRHRGNLNNDIVVITKPISLPNMMAALARTFPGV